LAKWSPFDGSIEERDWSVGLIVGPSGAGKSIIARELFGSAVVTSFDWPSDRSMLDGFPIDAGIKSVANLLNAVGFGSIPNWLRPFHVLSNGEQFRAIVARAMAETSDLVVIAVSSRLAPNAVCLGGFIGNQCVAFTSAKRFVHPIAKNLYQEHPHRGVARLSGTRFRCNSL
jgi:hypothetical protein